jgi:hypothetical protein
VTPLIVTATRVIVPVIPETTMSDGYKDAAVGALNPVDVFMVIFCVFEKTVCGVFVESPCANVFGKKAKNKTQI